jgi:hypothetical protein
MHHILEELAKLAGREWARQWLESQKSRKPKTRSCSQLTKCDQNKSGAELADREPEEGQK